MDLPVLNITLNISKTYALWQEDVKTALHHYDFLIADNLKKNDKTIIYQSMQNWIDQMYKNQIENEKMLEPGSFEEYHYVSKNPRYSYSVTIRFMI